MYSIGIIGVGRVGKAVAISLYKGGYRISGVNDTDAQLASTFANSINVPALNLESLVENSDVIFITTTDSQIIEVAHEIAKLNIKGKIIIHMSGMLESSALNDCKDVGASAVSLHPLQAFASVEEAKNNLPGSYFTFEGDEQAFDIAKEFVDLWQGKLMRITSGSKPLYHAAACIASNYLVTLIEESLYLFEKSGLDRETALEAVLPLVKGTVNNIAVRGTKSALTGPIIRGDISTVKKHIIEIRQECPEVLQTYQGLGVKTVQFLNKYSMLNRDVEDRLMDALLNIEDKYIGG